RLDLGAYAPVAKAVDDWRRAVQRRGHPGSGEGGPAALLRQKLWEPLLPHLKGVHTVLLSPDEDLARLPFAALPGSKPSTYLIEELPLAVVPVPQLLPELLAGKPGVGKAPSLLVVGDIDFGARPKSEAIPGVSRSIPQAGLRAWPRLPATKEEALAVRDSF